MRTRSGWLFTGMVLASCAQAQLQIGDLYGIGFDSASGVDTLYKISKSTGAATSVFSFNRPAAGAVNSLAFNSNTQKFVSVRTNNSSTYSLIEIDATALTAQVVNDGIPANIFEGVEFVSSLGGIVVSYSTSQSNPTTSNLALLDNSYGLVATRIGTGMADMDNLFVDENGFLNSVDTNNLTSGFQRWRFGSNLFTGTFTKASVGSNIYSATRPDSDHAYDAMTNQLFASMETSLGVVNTAGTSLITIGSYGVDGNGNAIRIRGLAVVDAVPEPATLTLFGVVGIGFLNRLRKRRN